jgi:IS1 family transposase
VNKKNAYVQVVATRHQDTLFDIVNRVVVPGTVTMTDGWRGYNKIYETYECKTVLHKYHCVDPDNVIHTDNIERLWRSLKKEIVGTCSDNYEKAINLFLFRRNYLTGSFEDKIKFL